MKRWVSFNMRILYRAFVFLSILVWSGTCQAAIAFDTSVDGGNNGGTTSSLTFSYTCTGSNTMLWVSLVGDVTSGADDISSVTFNSVSLTKLGSTFTIPAASRFGYVYYLMGCSGTHNIVISAASTHYLIAGAADYTGVKQTGQPSADNSNTQTDGLPSYTTSLTTVDNNSWVVLFADTYNSEIPALNAGTGATQRVYDGMFSTWDIFDSNGVITPAGSYSMTTQSNIMGSNRTAVMAAMSPATEVESSAPTFTVLGVGY